MSKKFKTLIMLVALIALVGLLVPAISLADVGGFSGDSDFGGFSGGSDWGGSSDWGGGYFLGGGSSPLLIIVVVVIYIIVAAVKKKRGSEGGGSNIPGATPTSAAELRSISELLWKDPEFSEAAFLEQVGNLYVQMQNAWQDKKFEPMRAHFTDALYNQLARQLEQICRSNRTNYIERIAVLGLCIVGWREDDVNDSIVVRLRTRIVDYTVDDFTGNVISGSRTVEKFMDYEWTLIRAKGVLTGANEGTRQTVCNACGAPVDINHSAKCEYCGSIITSSDYDWVIAAMKGISQRSGR